MNISNSLLYLLLLYAVLDKDNKLSLTNGLVIAFVVMLLNCYCRCNNSLPNTTATATSNNTLFDALNNVGV